MQNSINYYNKKYEIKIDYRYKTNTRYQRYLIQLLEKHISPNAQIESVCDIGCGRGLNTALFAEDFYNANILGIDLSEKGIDAATEDYKAISNLKFACMDANDLKITGQQFTLVTAFELLEHIEDWKHVAGLMVELSSRYIMVSSPVGRMRKYEKKHGHVRNFRKGELENFFEDRGCHTVKTYYAGFPFWSPITRDLLNFIPGDSTEMQKNLNLTGKVLSVILFYLYRYCSTIHYGDQFIGLFEKTKRGNH